MSLLRVMNRGVCTHTHTPIPSRPVSRKKKEKKILPERFLFLFLANWFTLIKIPKYLLQMAQLTMCWKSGTENFKFLENT